jgi:hypothetical protein
MLLIHFIAKRRIILGRSLTSLLLFLIPLSIALSGTNGKIAGNVTDAKTGEPVVGANVRLEGTSLGGSTDFEGNYFVINIPPNDYTLVVTMIGYGSKKITDVRVMGDLTTTIDIKLSETVLEVGQEVVVVGERPLVQKDLTAKTAIVSGKDISSMPVTEVGAVVSMQAGFVGENLRGGRAGEVAYWIDGVPVTDAFDGKQIVEVNKSLVQELQVVSGAFNAEYGQAMSGIVNISSKEGGSKYTGGISIYGGDYLPVDDKIFPGNKFNVTSIRNIEANISGPILSEKLTFFANVRHIYFNGYKKGFRRYNPWNYSVVNNDSLISIVPGGLGDGSVAAMDWSERSYAQGKLTWHINSLMKLSANYIYDNRRNKKYDPLYDRVYFYNPDGKGTEYNLSNTFIFQFNHSLSASTFYTLSGSYFNKDYKYHLYDLQYKDSTNAQGGHIKLEVVDPYGPHYVYPDLAITNKYSFMTGGTDLNGSHRTTETALIKLDLTSQIDGMNMIKVGAEYRSYIITNDSWTLKEAQSKIGFDYINVPQSVAYMRTQIPDIESPGHDYYEHRPIEFSAYIQDKMEYKNIIVNIGMRFDYFDPDGYVLNDSHPDVNDPLHYMYTVDDPYIYDPTRVDHWDVSKGGTTTLAERKTYWYRPATKKYAISPRLGVSFPITENGIVHFSYGHFFQIPHFERLYENPNFKISEVTSGVAGTYGNADLKPEQTVSAELGVQQQLTEDIACDVTVYMRDIRGLSQTGIYDIKNSGAPYAQYTNTDYGITKGLIVTIDKKFLTGLTARLDYTYQLASGTASDPQQARNARQGGAYPEIMMVPLDWDQRHTLNISVNYAADPWGASAIFQYGSGKPYTPISAGGTAIFVSTMNTNSQIKPAFFNCDLRAYYEIPLDPVKLIFFTRVFNVFDIRNQINVYPETGRADLAFDEAAAKETKLYVNTAEEYFRDCNKYSEPRRIEIGMNLEF